MMTKRNLTSALAGITILTTVITSGFTYRETNKGGNISKFNQHGSCSGNGQKSSSGSQIAWTNSLPDGPGTCSSGGGCHSGGSATPVFHFTATPAFTGNTYVPGTIYTVSIGVTGYPKFGFDLEMLNGQLSTSVAAGTFVALTKSTVHPAGTYPISITQNATILSTSTATFKWTAPASGNVYVYGDGNGVDGDGGTGGDKAVLYTLTLTPATTGTPPVAAFTASTTDCAGHAITMTDNSTNTPTSWSWTMTGGSPASSASQSPSVTYSTAGTYTVTLVASNSSGASSPVSHTITVNANPVVPTITPSMNTLSSSSTTGNQWYLNGTAINGATNQTYTATSGGSYTVVVTNSFGCSNTSAATNITTSNPPVANFTASTTDCAGQAIPLTDNSSNTPTSWSWTMTGGSPASSSTQSPSVTYSTAGTYTVTLVATNSSGSSSPVSHTITVNANPAVPTITVGGNTLTSSSTTGNQWYLNNALIGGATNQTYTATANGLYTVVVSNSFGCKATSTATNLTTTGISSVADNNIFTVFPNPSNGILNINFAGLSEHIIIEVINNLGQVVYTEKINDCTGDCHKTIDISSLGKGIYLLKIVANENIQTKKILLNK